MTWSSLSAIYKTFIEYGIDIECLDKEKADMLDNLMLWAIDENINRQNAYVQTQTPIKMFVDFLSEGIISGKLKFAHIGCKPTAECHGWVDAEYLYLLENSIYLALCTYFRKQNRLFPISQNALFSELYSAGFIEIDNDQENRGKTIRRTKKKTVCEGFRPRVVYFKKSQLKSLDL